MKHKDLDTFTTHGSSFIGIFPFRIFSYFIGYLAWEVSIFTLVFLESLLNPLAPIIFI